MSCYLKFHYSLFIYTHKINFSQKYDLFKKPIVTSKSEVFVNQSVFRL